MKDILINLYNSQIEGKLVREAEVAYTYCKGHCMTYGIYQPWYEWYMDSE